MGSYTVTVNRERSSYPVYVGQNLYANKELLTTHIAGRQVMIVTNETIAALYLPQLIEGCQEYQCDSVVLPDGEQYKTLATVNQIFDVLLTKKHTRTTTLLALGGGVIGDMAGFAAACYLRGVSFIQLPTTLLAQVDSAIGGKTGVNHPHGKNMIGAFHQPKAVIIDTDILQTLPAREFRAGLAEIIKYGLLQEAEFFTWIETHCEALLNKSTEALSHAIMHGGQIKAAMVAADEHDTQGTRALLNLGHTFAHALENSLGYGTWLHGEAVAVGLLLAADLSVRVGRLEPEVVTRIKELLQRMGLPWQIPGRLSAVKLLELMAGDKKNINSRLRFVLLNAIGQAVVTEEVPVEKVLQTLETFFEQK